MTIYTRTGDDGETALFGGGRVPKDDKRVEAYGAVDELNSFVGLALTSLADADVRRGLLLIQNDLFSLGANLATPEGDGSRPRPTDARRSRGQGRGDGALDRPGHRRAPRAASSSYFPVVPRRRPCSTYADRYVGGRNARWSLWVERSLLDDGIVPYLNRLSDLLFVWARLENHRAGHQDVPWSKE